MNIGVFDSGLGGLTILKEFLKLLPQYNYIYLGDNARAPYGARSQETIYQFTIEALDFLFKKDCQLVILACNTATANALRRIQHEYLPKFYPDRRVLGVIKPTIELLRANHKSPTTKIGVIGTKATVNSKAFVREIDHVLPNVMVYQQACPLLVPYIEDSGRNEKVLGLILKEYLQDLNKEHLDSLILACTHYEIIKRNIKNIINSKTKIISQGKIVAEKLKLYLTRHPEIETKLAKNKQTTYYITDLSEDYKKLMKLFLGRYLTEKINLLK